VEEFYARLDLAINPMQGGTGLKIKTLEGLSLGLPVLGTPDAWLGIGHPSTLLPEAASTDVVDGLRALASDDSLLPKLRARCRDVFSNYLEDQLVATRALGQRIEQLAAAWQARPTGVAL
jgi:hypothetical protein